VTRLGAAVLDLSALAALLGVVPCDPPAVDTAIAPDTALVDLADLLRSFHEHRAADVHGDLVLVGAAVSDWVPVSRYLATLTDLACARSDLSIGDAAALALARAAHLPLVTGVADLAGVDPEVAVFVLSRG
jgi:hypothetical protein